MANVRQGAHMAYTKSTSDLLHCGKSATAAGTSSRRTTNRQVVLNVANKTTIAAKDCGKKVTATAHTKAGSRVFTIGQNEDTDSLLVACSHQPLAATTYRDAYTVATVEQPPKLSVMKLVRVWAASGATDVTAAQKTCLGVAVNDASKFVVRYVAISCSMSFLITSNGTLTAFFNFSPLLLGASVFTEPQLP